MNKKDVLMVLPKKTIAAPSALKNAWDIDKDPQGITIYSSHRPVSRANWENSDEFGMNRPAITLILDEDADMDLFDAMISRLALAYEVLPERYPLYIRLKDDQLDLIAHASRMGFMPYFGTWKESSAEESVSSWQTITENLRTRSKQSYEAENDCTD